MLNMLNAEDSSSVPCGGVLFGSLSVVVSCGGEESGSLVSCGGEEFGSLSVVVSCGGGEELDDCGGEVEVGGCSGRHFAVCIGGGGDSKQIGWAPLLARCRLFAFCTFLNLFKAKTLLPMPNSK